MYVVHYFFITIAYNIVFMVTFCDDSFLIVFIQTEEDPLLYTVEKKLF